MRRNLGSVASTLALLLVAGGAAAVNVRVLDANRSEPSMLTAQVAAEVAGLDATSTSSDPSSTSANTATIDSTQPAGSATADVVASEPTATPGAPVPTPIATTSKPKVLGSVGGGRGDDDDDDEDDDHYKGRNDDDDDDKWRRPFGERPRLRGEFIPLTPDQLALLRVAALAQVSPAEARDAANGTGSATVVTRVKNAAAQIGVPLASIGSVTDIPPERGRRHGGDDDDDHEDDDDD